MPMPARSDSALTVLTSHSSVDDDGVAITRAPVDHLAIGLLISSEKIAPVKPTTSENASRLPSCSVLPDPGRPMPSSDRTMDSTSITARLVAINRTMRFIEGLRYGQSLSK